MDARGRGRPRGRATPRDGYKRNCSVRGRAGGSDGDSREVRGVVKELGELKRLHHGRSPPGANRPVSRFARGGVRAPRLPRQLRKHLPNNSLLFSTRVDTVPTSESAHLRWRALMSWRDALFIWRGRFSRKRWSDPDYKTFVSWKGTWIGVDAGGALEPDAPEIEKFADQSLPKFDVCGHHDPDVPEGFSGEYRLDRNTSLSMATRAQLGWQLEQAAGLIWFEDEEHRMRVDGDDVFAVGRNAFGPFVSVGFASGYACRLRTTDGETETEDAREVVLARRYLDERDARAKMRLDEWAAEARRRRDDGASSAAPWNVPAMASELVKATPTSKRARTAV